MGLDVGVVKITYLDRPPEPICDFLRGLTREAQGDSWGGAWEGNGLTEFYRVALLSKARSYARRRHLNDDDSSSLLQWVKELPWDGQTVMVHLSW